MTDEKDLPVLDGDALRALQDVAGPGPAGEFFEEYLLMLPVRTDAIVKGLGRSDVDACMEALTSLEVDSAVTGAQRLEQHCGDLRRVLEHSPCPDPGQVKAALFDHIRGIVREAGRQGHLPGRYASAD